MSRIFFIFFAGILSVASFSAGATKWPIIPGGKITRCSDKLCTNVAYVWEPTAFTDNPVQERSIPGISTKKIGIVGIHCSGGSPGNFNGCFFLESEGTGLNHFPNLISKCETISGSSWELTPDSTCETKNKSGGHDGARPGAECALFGIKSGAILYTPFGDLTASQVANDRSNLYCVKPIAPNVECKLETVGEPVIDHGTVNAGAVSVKTKELQIDCGENPVINVVGGTKVSVGGGMYSELKVGTVNNGIIELTSTINTAGAEAGTYQGSAVIAVQPQ